MKQGRTYNVDVFTDPNINNHWKDALWVPKVIVVNIRPKNETDCWYVAEFTDNCSCNASGETIDDAYENLITKCESLGILISRRLYELIKESQYIGHDKSMHRWELLRIIHAYHSAFITLTNASYKNDVILRYELASSCLCGCCHETVGYIKDADKETKLFSGESIEEIVTDLAASTC